MLTIKNINLLSFSLFFIVNANAAISPDQKALADQCRKEALVLNYLSADQTRPICRDNRDGEKAYYASQYILAEKITEAKDLLDIVIIQIKFAMDIGCVGNAIMDDAVTEFQYIRDNL